MVGTLLTNGHILKAVHEEQLVIEQLHREGYLRARIEALKHEYYELEDKIGECISGKEATETGEAMMRYDSEIKEVEKLRTHLIEISSYLSLQKKRALERIAEGDDKV